MAPGSRLQELTAKYMQNPRRFFVPLANEYRKGHDLDRAIALCREHLSSQPGHMSGHIVLARAYYEKGDIAAAREVFLTSVELDDENLIALRHLGDIARARNDVTEARQWYVRVLDADPQNEEMERVLRALSAPAATASAASPLPELVVMPFDVPADAPTVATASAVSTPPVIAPAMELAMEPAIESALSDPTPPGLRAILSPSTAPVAPDPKVRGPGDVLDARPDPRVPLDRFDLSTLGAESTEPGVATPPDAGTGIQVDDGVGFLFDELDELVDPAASPGANATLPPIEEGDFSAGIATPTQPPAIGTEQSPDELLSRPAFGALASFASWRTAQARETPTHVPAQSVPADVDNDDDADGMFTPSLGSDSTPTAPEFVTETMAALYAQQGFVQQALDVYRALHLRAPDDPGLRAKVAEMEQLLASPSATKSLEEDADNALQFGDLHDDGDVPTGDRSMLETMYGVSPPDSDADLASAFDSGWDAPAASADDDWFGGAPAPDLSSDGGYGGDEIFGVSDEVFGQPSALGATAGRPVSSAQTATLESVFGSPGVVVSDATAADMLLALAEQMVGRLPKEAPTLPVPDILELPSSVPGDDAKGTSPAPLLSFDRFFSGSGSPPRVRVDTPAARQDPLPWLTGAPTPVPSLSPTFGGLPVIPPPPAATPAVWGGFDQFVPPPSAPSVPLPVTQPSNTPATRSELPPVDAAAIATPVDQPALPFLEPQTDPVPASPILAAPETPVDLIPVDHNPVGPQRMRTEMPAALRPAPPVPPAAQPTDPAGDTAVRSDFHRWLEGLS